MRMYTTSFVNGIRRKLLTVLHHHPDDEDYSGDHAPLEYIALHSIVLYIEEGEEEMILFFFYYY